MILWLWFACQREPEPAPPTEDAQEETPDTGNAYVPPEFDGDGLPDPVDTDRDDGRDDQPTLDTADTGDTAVGPSGPPPTITVVDALVIRMDDYLNIQLFVAETTCADWQQAGVGEGVAFFVPAAVDDWTFPGAPGFAFYGIGTLFGEPEGRIAVRSIDPHYVELQWDLDVTGPGGGRYYNCGDVTDWTP